MNEYCLHASQADITATTKPATVIPAVAPVDNPPPDPLFSCELDDGEEGEDVVGLVLDVGEAPTEPEVVTDATAVEAAAATFTGNPAPRQYAV